MMAVLVVAVAALALPMAGLRAGASSSPASIRPSRVTSASVPAAAASQQQVSVEALTSDQQSSSNFSVSPEIVNSVGVVRSKDKNAVAESAQALSKRNKGGSSSDDFSTQSGQPTVLNARSALSAAMLTNLGGRDNQFDEVTLVADWDGREDCAADREQKVDDLSETRLEIDYTLTRTGISEHTVANGFNENVYYYGDSQGNFWYTTDANPGVNQTPNGAGDFINQINIPALLNGNAGATSTTFNVVSTGGVFPRVVPLSGFPAGDCMDDQVAVTGIAVNPVSDLGDFGLCGTIGEVVYVSVWDTEGCSSAANGQVFRTRIFAFGFRDATAAEVAGGLVGLVPVGVSQILRSPLSNIAGVAVDDDSNLYFQLIDFTDAPGGAGGAIFKVTELPRIVAAPGGAGLTNPVTSCPACPRINRVISSIPSGLTGGIGLNTALGTSAAPVLTAGGYRLTNYGRGASTLYGNIVAMDAGPCNVLYAAVAASQGATGIAADLQGAFNAPAAYAAAGLPSMIISFADCGGGFDLCTAAAPGNPANLGGVGTIPVADGFADPASGAATGAATAGVNTFRLFVQGNVGGPNVSGGGPATTAAIPGATTGNTLAPIDMLIDYTLHSGISVSEEGTVFVISGGTPAGVGKAASPMRGEILCFEDMCPMDRRADPVDLRGDTNPAPPASGGNVGDGDSDRFDHIFYQSPLDQVTITPGGLAGLSRGFLRYTNRLAPNAMGPGVALGVTQTIQTDDSTSGPIVFENLDPGHQVAGGDDQNTPFRGDDNDALGAAPTANNPGNRAPDGPLVGALSGGFEFIFGAAGTPGSTCVNNVWNSFWLNSNGNITFGGGDTDNTATVAELRSGLPRIAPAWTDLNPGSRATDCCALEGVQGGLTFPVQAVGFANVNAFKIRWLNVPEFGTECCSTSPTFGISGNSFSVTLYDDGTGLDENHDQALDPADPTGDNVDPAFDRQEGPTDLRFAREPVTQTLIGCPPRPEGSGIFVFEYCAMQLLGTASNPVIAGYSIGGQLVTSPPGICETDLGEAARAADLNPFGVIQTQTAGFCQCLLGEGTEPTLYELFNEATSAGLGDGGNIIFAAPDFDLRFEGNDPQACTPTRQGQPNRGKIAFRGVACPQNPLCITVTPVLGSLTPVAPGQPAVGGAGSGSQFTSGGTRINTPTSGIINAVCAVQLNVLGCGFFPNEVTQICAGVSGETGPQEPRPGKTVTTTADLFCRDALGQPSIRIPLNVTGPANGPQNCNLVRVAVVPPSGGAAGALLTGTGFPAACCGGLADLVVTTTFTAGTFNPDNNIFGNFTRSTTCTIDLGVRAPVVFSVTPSDGSCAILQNLIITGACFLLPNGTPNVTSVCFQQSGVPTNRICVDPSRFKVLGPNLIDVEVTFGTANAGRTFLVFVTGPSGTSQNLIGGVTVPPGSTGCPAGFTGNQQGVAVSFTCSTSTVPETPGTPIEVAVITSCALDRDPANGVFTLDIIGTGIKSNATLTVGGIAPKKVKFKDLDTGTNSFRRLSAKKRVCEGLAAGGQIVITNPAPNGRASQPFTCSARCPNE